MILSGLDPRLDGDEPRILDRRKEREGKSPRASACERERKVRETQRRFDYTKIFSYSLLSPLDLHHLFGDHASDFPRSGSRASRDARERLESPFPSTCRGGKKVNQPCCRFILSQCKVQ